MSGCGECSTVMDEAFVSLATNDSYCRGALTLARSLRDCGTNRRLALMVTSGVSREMRGRLSRVWDEVVDIEELDSGDAEHLALLSRPELGITFSKVNAWRLIQYSKCVFLDADTLVLQNVDELFDRDELSAAPDIGWPDCFNSGVFVFEPSFQTFYNLMELSRETGSFDGGDQGLLNLYWCDWATKDIKYHLPFTFNVTPNVTYGYAPAFQRFGHEVKIIHFIGPIKPWQHRYLPEVDAVILYPGTYASQNAAQDYIKRWWQLYTSLEKDFYSPSNLHSELTTHHHHQDPCLSHLPSSSTPPHQDGNHPSHSDCPEHAPAPPILPNLGSGLMPHDPYQQVDSGRGYAYSHAITPLDSISQFEAHRYFLRPVVSEYKHLVSPLDSVHHFAPSLGSSGDAGNDSSSTSHLLSPLSHGDVHSHISLSFYSQNAMFERISCLAYTEPRTYYVQHTLPDLEQDALGYVASTEGLDDSLGSSGSHFNPVPSYHTPPSLACPPSTPSLLVDPELGFYRSYPLAASTEHDEMHASRDCQVTPGGGAYDHVTAPSLPPIAMVEEGGESDSVLPVINPSFPLPPTAHAPLSPSPNSLPLYPASSKGLEYFSSGSQTSMMTTESQVGGDHRKAFEAGSIDVRGRDSFPNIQAHIDYILSQGTSDSDTIEEQKEA